MSAWCCLGLLMLSSYQLHVWRLYCFGFCDNSVREKDWRCRAPARLPWRLVSPAFHACCSGSPFSAFTHSALPLLLISIARVTLFCSWKSYQNCSLWGLYRPGGYLAFIKLTQASCCFLLLGWCVQFCVCSARARVCDVLAVAGADH